jgi:hypothetical protein
VLAKLPEAIGLSVAQRFGPDLGEHFSADSREVADRQELVRGPAVGEVDVVTDIRCVPGVGDHLAHVAALGARQDRVLPAGVSRCGRGRRLPHKCSASARSGDEPLAGQPLVSPHHRQVVDPGILGQRASGWQLRAGGKLPILDRATNERHELGRD